MSQGKSTQPKIKIVVLGMHSAGKTTLVDRLIHERFLGPMGATVGAAYNSFELALDKNRKLTLAIWDTAGAERFESMTKSYYKDAEGALLCFDVTDANSWNKVKFWAQELQAVEENCVLAIVATKVDLVESGEKSRAVPQSTVRKFANTLGCQVFETSAKLGSLKGGNAVNEPFEHLAREVVKKKDPWAARATPAPNVVNLNQRQGPAGGQQQNPNCCGK